MRRLALMAVAAGSLMLGLFLGSDFSVAQKDNSSPPPILKFGDPLPANTFIELAKAVNPAVVNISTSSAPRPRSRGPRDPFFDMLERFYGVPMMPQQRPQQSLGTGFIIRDDGLIVTNNHVISGAEVIQVSLSQPGKKSEKTFEATLVGSDDRTDIALIRIKSKERLPVVALGNSSEVQVGEWVAAFGNPFGQSHTMTKGIISATGRDISEINRFPLLQTDAPINPGNSGGPLVNLKGQVIGVNSAIDARAQGIGFAIPIDEVKTILPQLEKTGRIRMGYLGVGLAELDAFSAQQLGLKNEEGALIAGVEPGLPADKAGLKPYDVVIEFNGRKIETGGQLRDAIAGANIGTKAKVKVLRDGKEKTFDVEISERPDSRQQAGRSQDLKGKEAPFKLGFSVGRIDLQTAQEWGLPTELVARPVITDVESRSVAAQAGLRPGDVILDVNRREVRSPDEALKNLKKGSNTLRIAREGVILIVVLRPQE